MRREDLLEKLLSNVTAVPIAGCWLWLGGSQSRGYGAAVAEGRGQLRETEDGLAGRGLVHVMVYTLLVGPVPEGAVLRHRCDTRLCCNPHHLDPGTHSQNMRDMMERGRGRNQFAAKQQEAAA